MRSTATWIQTEGSVYDGKFELPGCSLFRKKRPIGRGGGVAIYVRNHIGSSVASSDTAHKFISVEIYGIARTEHIFLVYRPPEQSLELLKHQIRNKIVVMIGNFNCNVVWEN